MLKKLSRRLLQIFVALGGCVPVGAGLVGVLHGPRMVGDISMFGTAFDSHFRYLSGLLLGIGLAFWSTIPHIEKHRERYQVLSLIVFLGGASRLYAIHVMGEPRGDMILACVMELLITPLLALWQYRVSRPA